MVLHLSEDFEQKRLVEWLEANGYVGRFFAVPNSTVVKGPNKYETLARLTAMGVRRGAPDMIIALKRGEMLWLELKAINGTPSDEQLHWKRIATLCHQPFTFAYGHRHAIQLITEFENAQR